MTSIVAELKTAAQKRAAYTRTVHELQSMPLNTALDLGIFREDAAKIAKRAVYGH
ncbi:MAG: hypothetical protein HKN63_10265 [Rhodobacteraceae bacterium]|nr:hypothetical protein [Paracoccaceae bacterium]